MVDHPLDGSDCTSFAASPSPSCFAAPAPAETAAAEASLSGLGCSCLTRSMNAAMPLGWDGNLG